ncbi:hypothetical protein EXT46_06590 [Pseudoalteromonas sp. CO325X]|uniref:hypothetical protein n=1 Tax=Pseudoalteromonas sp. CO325X TaxID=1777262 RepID=UPI001023552B|nr:hypothetical protein [Pseudoalteromonas sp. CO325X]RZF83115.1 hypothetical protein EXT46_06590 [Pseudoalteromonas sp. CO325X]
MKYRDTVEKLSREHPLLIERLINTYDLEEWAEITQGLSKNDKNKIYGLAEPKWIEKNLSNGSLLLHPDARAELMSRNFKPLSAHCKMVWASFLVNLEGEDSKIRFNRIKKKIIKKHSNKWWFDVHKRIKPTYAAKSRLDRQSLGNAASHAVENSSYLRNMAQGLCDDALKMIPK